LSGALRASRWFLRAVFWGTVAAIALLIVGICVVYYVIPIFNPPPKTYRYVFPADFATRRETTFVLRTMVPGAPPLPREDGFRLVRFDRAQSIDTSEEYEFGSEYFREEYYVVDGERRRKLDDVDCRPSHSVAHRPLAVICRRH